MDEIAAPSRLDIALGEHLATVRHRGKDGQAILTFTADSVPRADVDGWDLPDDAVTRDATGTVVGGHFPAYDSASELRGWMRSGAPIALLDTYLTFMQMDRAHVACNTVLVGFGVDAAPDLRFERLRLQVTGLGEILGFGMIGASIEPTRPQPKRWGTSSGAAPDRRCDSLVTIL